MQYKNSKQLPVLNFQEMEKREFSTNWNKIIIEAEMSKCMFDLRMKILEQKCAFYGCEMTKKDFTILN